MICADCGMDFTKNPDGCHGRGEDECRPVESPRSPGGSAAKLDGPHNGATMDTHELAEKLLEGPRRELTASVDLSSGDDDHGRRAFGDLVGLQYEADGETATLFFEDGYINE